MQVLDQYFDALRNCDWQSLAQTLAEDVHRTGPFLDVVQGKRAYVDFLSGVIPAMKNYELVVSRTRKLEDGEVLVELSEILDLNGERREFPEALTFGFDSAGRILRVNIFIKQPPADQGRMGSAESA